MVTTGVLTVAAGIACVLGERFYNGAEDSVMLSAAFIAFWNLCWQMHLLKESCISFTQRIGTAGSHDSDMRGSIGRDAVGQGARPWHGNNRSGRCFVK